MARFDLVLLVRPSIGEVLAFNACAARSSVMPRANRSALDAAARDQFLQQVAAALKGYGELGGAVFLAGAAGWHGSYIAPALP